ncbi:MAG TPA: hypothetical protein VHD87_15045 [Acidimicrobiales bacterium]|nr:hypothetical protein [Acidimicrobiales bacterium]
MSPKLRPGTVLFGVEPAPEQAAAPLAPLTPVTTPSAASSANATPSVVDDDAPTTGDAAVAHIEPIPYRRPEPPAPAPTPTKTPRPGPATRAGGAASSRRSPAAGQPDCVLGVLRGSGPRARVTLGVPPATKELIDDVRANRRWSTTDVVLNAVAAYDGVDVDLPAGRIMIQAVLAESEKNELERIARDYGLAVSRLVANAVHATIDTLTTLG